MRFNLPIFWYQKKLSLLFYLLLPFSYIFRFIIFIRRFLYKINLFKTHSFSVPVIIVGNVTAGGTGKTPFVIWLAKLLRAKGYQPGIVSRGVGGKKNIDPHLVTLKDSPNEVGDEALLLAKQTACPIMIGINRPLAVKKLLDLTDCDMIISDDGLQHYALNRNMEIVIVDGDRQFGNGYLLPAGPLREPVTRLNEVDFIVVNGQAKQNQWEMNYIYDDLISLSHPNHTQSLMSFSHQKIHAVAGIGHPERFFSVLKNAGFNIIPHIFPDHYSYQSWDFNFASHDSFPIIMTEKDAVKCQSFSDERYWYLPVTAQLSEKFSEKLLEKLNIMLN